MARKSLSQYAVYRGDEFVYVGTAEECAVFMGWKNKKVTTNYASPSVKKKLAKRADYGNRQEVFKVGEIALEQTAELEELEQPTAKRGKLLNVFGVIGEDGLHHQAAFVFSRGRKHADLLTVLDQEEKSKKARLSKYGQSLYDSCFRNW